MLKTDIEFLENISKTVVRKVLHKLKIDKLFSKQVFSKPSYCIKKWACGTTVLELVSSKYYSREIELDDFHKNYISMTFNLFSLGNFRSIAGNDIENCDTTSYRSFHYSNRENEELKKELSKNIELFLTKEKIETLKTLLSRYELIKSENESWKEKYKVIDYFHHDCPKCRQIVLDKFNDLGKKNCESSRVYANNIKCEDILNILILFKEKASSINDDELLVLCLGNDEKITECVIYNEDYEQD